jgi:hypothetical protein
MSAWNDTANPRSDAGVETAYYENTSHASFYGDVLAALREAHDAEDTVNSEKVWDLWVKYFEDQLPAMGVRRLIDYLEGHRVWRYFGNDPVYKTVDTPCLAFTAVVNDAEAGSDEKVTLIALGCCYKYPAGDEEGWWREVILPRLRSM